LKEKGNAEFKVERYTEALAIFEEAIECTPLEEKGDIAILHNNRGICF
jgi:tetratricopeptide (TPR) repeat protein